MNYQTIINTCYSGDASIKLSKAEELVAIHGDQLLARPDIKAHLALIAELVQSLDTHMSTMDMGKTCTHCAKTPEGGCCSAYMGNENPDSLLLLMNILAGVKVERVCENGVECCFLGTKGCILLFKPIFCLNYLCERIQNESDRDELGILEKKTGKLLTAQSNLEQVLILFLQKQR